jgi:hypothetical protein
MTTRDYRVLMAERKEKVSKLLKWFGEKERGLSKTHSYLGFWEGDDVPDVGHSGYKKDEPFEA